MKIWFDFAYVRLLRRLGSWLLSHSGFSKFVLSALLSRCWNHFRLIFIWKILWGNGIASVEPVAFPFFCEKERLEVVAFAFQFLESRAFRSVISLPKPFSVLSFIWKLPDGLELHRFDPLRFLFFLEKRMVGISCLRIPVSRKLHFSALFSRCRNPFPVNLLSEKLLWGIRICPGLTRCIFFFG